MRDCASTQTYRRACRECGITTGRDHGGQTTSPSALKFLGRSVCCAERKSPVWFWTGENNAEAATASVGSNPESSRGPPLGWTSYRKKRTKGIEKTATASNRS